MQAVPEELMDAENQRAHTFGVSFGCCVGLGDDANLQIR